MGKLAGINIIFDPDYDTQNQTKPQNLELVNASLDEALDDRRRLRSGEDHADDPGAAGVGAARPRLDGQRLSAHAQRLGSRR